MILIAWLLAKGPMRSANWAYGRSCSVCTTWCVAQLWCRALWPSTTHWQFPTLGATLGKVAQSRALAIRLGNIHTEKNSNLSAVDLWIYPSSSPFSQNIVLRFNQNPRNLYILLITTNYEKVWQHIYQPQSILLCLLSQATPIRMLYCPDWTTFLGLLLWGARSCLLSWAWLPVALDFIPCVGGIASEE